MKTRNNHSLKSTVLLFLFGFLMNFSFAQENPVQKKTGSLKSNIPEYYSAFEFGLKKGMGDLKDGLFENTGTYLSLGVVFPIRIKGNFSIGPGIGIDTYEHGAYMPIFADFRYHFGNGNIMPFLITDLGYSFGWMKDDKGPEWAGLLINPGVGVALKLKNKLKYYLKFSYKIQRCKTIQTGMESFDVDAEFIDIKIAFVF